ncbi:hypothetical protein QWZ03_00330 [Chitinimonas viridis]|uniref:Uncharacterized protein n=1 Tax=Chitinimonas viridis TaxID=664880 RepID=A0ABT8B163_9NEIS|nr:hypothetical protein [Chitinimonas viridis]MDN3575219.1 hypothetical protein [Chitinimonas viridis]
MLKFGFRIRTKTGAVVDNLVIQAHDLTHAEAKLLQMYHHATVLEAKPLDDTPRGEGVDLESAISLIIGRDDTR